MAAFGKILLATDFSDASRTAFEAAVKIARDSGGRLDLVHVYQIPPAASLGFAPPGIYEDFERAVRADAEKKLEALVAEARGRGVEARPLALAGFPDEEIVNRAKHEQADLIVMGTHGRRGAARLFLGSVASRVVTTAPCPVMTVRAGG
jgi:nucleotide-binding universal stress UspA family protein